ncbi:MAG: Kelch repeat-containing protein, partial [Planctomycetota bacterium]
MRALSWITLLAVAFFLTGCPSGSYSDPYGKPPESTGNPELTFSPGDQFPTDGQVSNSQAGVVIAQIKMQAGSGEDVRVTSMTFQYGGTGSVNALNAVYLYHDQDNNGIYSAFDILLDTTSSPAATIAFNGVTQVIPAGTDQHWILVYDFNGSDPGNNTFTASLSGPGAIQAEGATSLAPATIFGAAMNGRVVTTMVIGSLFVAPGSSHPAAASIQGNEANHIMMHILISAGATENVTINQARFHHQGTGSVASRVSSVVLVRDDNGNGLFDGSPIDTILDTFIPTGSILDFSFVGDTIPNTGVPTGWFVLYNFNGLATVGETFQVVLQNGSDLNATGDQTSQTIIAAGPPIFGGSQSIPTGTLAVAPGPNMPPGLAVTIPSTIAVLQISLTTGPTEDISISSITFNDIGGGLIGNVRGAHLLKDDGGTPGVYDPGPTTPDTPLILQNLFQGRTLTFNFSPAQQITKSTTENWILVYDWNQGTAGTYQATLDPATQINATGTFSMALVNPTGSAVQGNVFSLTGTAPLPTTWTPLPSIGGPAQMIYASGVYDVLNQRLLVFAGTNSPNISGGATQLTFALNTAAIGAESWSPLSPGGVLPPVRYGHTAVVDTTGQQMIIFGGYDNVSPNPNTQNDTHALSLSGGGNGTWAQIVPVSGSGPARAHAAAVYDSIGNRMIVFGGFDNAGTANNGTHILNLGSSPTWTTQATTNTPSPRAGHIAAYDTTSNKMLIFGGWNGTTYYNDTHLLDLSTWQWTPLAPATPPSVRAEMAFGDDGSNRRLFIFG